MIFSTLLMESNLTFNDSCLVTDVLNLNSKLSDIEVPFPSQREAEIAYNVLRVGSEPKRSQVQKLITFNNHMLKVKFCGEEARQLRVAVNGFMDHLILCSDTIAKYGPPVAVTYEHF